MRILQTVYSTKQIIQHQNCYQLKKMKIGYESKKIMLNE